MWIERRAVLRLALLVALVPLLSGCGGGIALLVGSLDSDDGTTGEKTPAPVTAPHPDPIAWRIGEDDSFVIAASGGRPPYTYALESGHLPEGVRFSTIDNELRLDGMPTDDVGKYDTMWTITDGANQSATFEVTVYVTPHLTLEGLPDPLYAAWQWPVALPGSESEDIVVTPGGGYARNGIEEYDLELITIGAPLEGLVLSKHEGGAWRLWGSPLIGGPEIYSYRISVRDVAFGKEFPECPPEELVDYFPNVSGFPSVAEVRLVDPVRIVTKSLPPVPTSGHYGMSLESQGGGGPYRWQLLGPRWLYLQDYDRHQCSILRAEYDRDGSTIRLTFSDLASGASCARTFCLPSWRGETVDSEGDVGAESSIALAADGTVWVSYYDVSNQALKVARRTPAGEWEEPKTVDSGGDVGTFSSVGIAGDGTVWVSYYDEINDDLKVVCRTPAGQWQQPETVDSQGSVGSESSIALAADGTVWVSYRDAWPNEDVKVVRRTPAGEWQEPETVDGEGNVGTYYTSLGIAADGTVWVSYYDWDNSDLKVARRTPAGEWQEPQTVDSEGDVGKFSSVGIAGDGTLWVSYYDESNDDLKLVCRTPGGQWQQPETVDSEGSVGEFTSLAIALDGTVWVSYYDVSNHDLKVVRRSPVGEWQEPETVDSEGWVGLDTSLGIAVDGTVWVSHLDVSNYDLKVMRLSPPCEWQEPETVISEGNVGEFTSLAIAADRTVWVSYHDVSNHDLKVVRRTPGGEWLEPETVDSEGQVGSWNSLAIAADGTVWVSYHDVSNHDLKVLHRTPEGEWLEPETVDSEGDVGDYTSLGIALDGTVWVSYYDRSGRDLRVVHRSPTGGWQEPETVVSEGNAGEFTSLAIALDGTVWVTYAEEGNHDLKAVCRTPAGEWLEPETVDSEGDVGDYTSLGIAADGTVWLSYYDWGTDALKVVRRTPAGEWQQPETADSRGNAGEYTSLGIAADGTVWVSYWDEINEDLKVVGSFSRHCVIAASYKGEGPRETFHIAWSDHETIRAVPILLRLTGDSCSAVNLGLTWDPRVAVLDPDEPVTFQGCHALERLHGGNGPAAGEFQIDYAEGTGTVSIRIDLSELSLKDRFPPYFEEVISYLYFRGASTENGASCDLKITGFGEAEEPAVTLSRADGDVAVKPITMGSRLQIRGSVEKPPPSETQFLRGDANSDMRVDVSDAIFVLVHLFANGDTAALCHDAMDANDDGALDVGDAVAIMARLFSGAAPLPEPYGQCGTDPTEDTLTCRSYHGCPAHS